MVKNIFVMVHDKKHKHIKLKYPSKTRQGTQHTLTTTEDLAVVNCSCEAGQRNMLCWHKRHGITLLQGIFNEHEVPNETVA